MGGDASGKFKDITEATTTKLETTELWQKVAQMREELTADYETKFQDMYRVAAMQDSVDGHFLRQRDENEQMALTFNTTNAEIQQKSATLEEMLKEARTHIDE